MDFYIDEQYITDVTVRTDFDLIKDRVNPTPEDLIKVLLGQDKGYSICSKDHDEFTKLRNELEEKGYIKTERSWWNGDTVLKPFTINGAQYRKGYKFPCASAMRVCIEIAKKKGVKYKPSRY